ncbi:MAG: RecX family transcriptional regulator [Planctomycetota bacterium]
MDVVISVTPSVRDANRVTVRVGQPGRRGRSVGTLSARLVEGLGVSAGDAWTEALAERFAEALAVDKAMRDGLSKLNRRGMSRRDLNRKLREKGHAAEARAAALDRLAELGVIDDAAYGAALAEETVRRKGAGPRLVEQKLRAKGLDGGEARRLADAATGDAAAQRAAATAAAEKKLRSMTGLDAATRRRRLYGLLGRRGYTPDVISDVMEAMADRLEASDE